MVDKSDSERLLLTSSLEKFDYEHFLLFRKRILAPNMSLNLVEEDYDKEIWDELFNNWGAIHEISRGHGKSELGVQLFIFMGLLQPRNALYAERLGSVHKMSEFLIVSSDNTAVSELRDRLVDYFLSSDALRTYIPDGVQKRDMNAKYNTGKVTLTNGTVFHFRPIKTKRGLHVDAIWVDDPTTESSTLTDKQTDDFLTGAIMPMGVAKSALFWMTGTPIRLTDILSTMARKKAYFHMKRPALVDNNPISKRFTIGMLDDIKRKIGSLKFSSEYMLNPLDDGVSLIKKVWIDACKDERLTIINHRKGYDSVVVGVDFSFGDTAYSKGGGDYFIAVVLGVIGEKKYLLNILRRRDLSTVEQLQYVRELHAIYRFDSVALEFNSIRALANNLNDLNLPLRLYNTGSVDERDKKKPDFGRVISVSKRNMITRQGIQLENKLIVLPYGDDQSRYLVDLYSEEATSWALEEDKLIELGRHPDIPMAFGFALETSCEAGFIIEW